MSEKTCPCCGHTVTDYGLVQYNPETRIAFFEGAELHLTSRQALMLAALASVKGRVADKNYIMEHMYGLEADWPDQKIIDVLVCKMRRKLPKGLTIETVWGRGYRLLRTEDFQAEQQKLVA